MTDDTLPRSNWSINKTFDEPKGYYYGCVGAGTIDGPPGEGAPPSGVVNPVFGNGSEASYNVSGWDSTAPQNALGGGGGIVALDAGAGAPVWTLGIPAALTIVYAVSQRRGDGPGRSAGGSGGGGGII